MVGGIAVVVFGCVHERTRWACYLAGTMELKLSLLSGDRMRGCSPKWIPQVQLQGLRMRAFVMLETSGNNLTFWTRDESNRRVQW